MPAGERPPGYRPPPHLSPSPPVPQPEEVAVPPETGREAPDPTRYGDWEMNGIAVDF